MVEQMVMRMKESHGRAVILVYFILVLGLLMVGCSTKEDPPEELIMCGNHSCGNLVMVTTDTSSDGYQYLEPALSPDGNTIVFTADWGALPSTDRPPDPLPFNRQLILVPVREGTEPETELAISGATLIFMPGFNIEIAGNPSNFFLTDTWQKGDPIWMDNQTVIFWIQIQRGNRLYKVDITQDPALPVALYFEPEDMQQAGRFWQHVDPALSPDGRWLAFARHGCWDPEDLSSCSGRSIWVLDMETAGLENENIVFPITSEVSQSGGTVWSPDGSHLAFYSSLDLVGEGGNSINEIFTVVFDTTGLAATGAVALDNELRRVTFTHLDEGDPLTGIKNLNPAYTDGGASILFESTRRAPSITLHDRSIWKVPADGRRAPEIYFFSREDDVDPDMRPGPSGELIFSSAMGFPTEMLDRLEQEAFDRFLEAGMSETAAAAEAREEREELEFFARVMSHIYIYTP